MWWSTETKNANGIREARQNTLTNSYRNASHLPGWVFLHKISNFYIITKWCLKFDHALSLKHWKKEVTEERSRVFSSEASGVLFPHLPYWMLDALWAPGTQGLESHTIQLSHRYTAGTQRHLLNILVKNILLDQRVPALSHWGYLTDPWAPKIVNKRFVLMFL